MSKISVRLNEQEETLFKTYAEFMDETLSTLFKKALLEKKSKMTLILGWVKSFERI